MYLKEIVAHGFKSFADRTRIDLRPGVTAVVGPNGCGKSNIVDAIRWVLGEQSAKSLRASTGMQDMIFMGTDRRKPLPQCEVELIFADCEKELGTEFAEISVMRRLQREGASDYFINGKPARLKDIQRLFMDTGIGRMSYSFMVQGQIDQVLSANPAERRYLFEEAAGITRYKIQRREALNKLAGVDSNLARITDVIGEVGRQIASLRRQAAKALRYRRLSHRLTHLDLALLSKQFGEQSQQVTKLDAEAAQCREESQGLTDSLQQGEQSLLETRTRRATLAEQVQQAQQALFDIRAQRENAEAEAKTADLRADDLSNRIAKIKEEIAEAERALADFNQRLQGSSSTHQDATGNVSKTDANYREKESQLAEVSGWLTEAENQLRRARQDILMVEGEMTRARGDVTNLEVDLRSYQTRHVDLSASLAQVKEERTQHELRANSCAQVVTARHGDLEQVRQTELNAQEKGRSLLAEFRQLQQVIAEQDRKVAKLSAQLGLLEQMQARLEGFSEAAKALLRGELTEVVQGSKLSALADLVTLTDVSAAASLESILGAASEAVALDKVEHLPGLVAKLGERQLGRAIFQVAAPAASRLGTPAPAWLRAASTVVQAKANTHTALIANLFDGCYLCESLADFVTWWQANPQFEFFLVATKAGDLVDRRGLVYAGQPRSKASTQAGAGVFSRESEIRSVRTDLEKENDQLTSLNEKAMGLQSLMDANEAEITQIRQQLQFATQELSVAQADERAARAALTASDDRMIREQRSLGELEIAKAEATQRRDRAQETLTAKDKQVADLRALIASSEVATEKARAEVDLKRNAFSEARLSLATQRQELELINRELSDLQSRHQETQRRLQARQIELQQNEKQIAEWRASATKSRENSTVLAQAVEQAQQDLESHRNALVSVDNVLEAADRELGGRREQLRVVSTRLNSLEVNLASLNSQTGFIREKVQAEYQLDVATIDWRLQLWLADGEPEGLTTLTDLDDSEEAKEDQPAKVVVHRGEPTADDLTALEATDWQPLSREIVDLRERIKGMGSVNLVAVEEYSSLRERHDFLTKQSDDLWKSKEELTKAIGELNQTSLELFTATFEQVRKNFKFTFERLFVGGSADLQMVQGEDVLEGGIEIIAQPPGAKLKTISLLSGGQRTMTAVALLFAIYMVKPSPLCVLDEIDAALDDTNVGRFTDIIRDFTKFSQFIVITHNKRTVSAADVIFGATMQEKGVTRLFSMRFNKDKDEAEPAGPGSGFTMAR